MENIPRVFSTTGILPRMGYCILLIVYGCYGSLQEVKAEVLTVAIDNYPPWTIIDTWPYQGIDVEIVKTLADDLSLTVKFVPCPFKRCLALIENGQVDLIPGLFKTPEREKSMLFIEPPYFDDPPKVFYLKKGAAITLNEYQDLEDLSVGVKRGASYFEKFDNDLSLKKFAVTSEIQLLGLLKKGRIDTFVSTASLADYLIAKEGYEGEFTKAPFRYGSGDMSYFAISRKSKFADKAALFQQSIKKALSNDTYNKIARDFYYQLSSKKQGKVIL